MVFTTEVVEIPIESAYSPQIPPCPGTALKISQICQGSAGNPKLHPAEGWLTYTGGIHFLSIYL